MFYTKKIKENEYNFYYKLKDTDIIPEIIFTESKNIIKLVKYPMTFEKYFEKMDENQKLNDNNLFIICEKINKLIEKLHLFGIFHGDLHTENIVVDPDNLDVRLIDFGESRLINKINQTDIKYFNDFLDPESNIGKKFENVEDMLRYETKNWKLCFDI